MKEHGYCGGRIIIAHHQNTVDAESLCCLLKERFGKVPVEIQIRTLAMDLWASLEHDIKYKSLSNKEESLDAMELDMDEELLQAAELIYAAQQKFEIMNSAMEK